MAVRIKTEWRRQAERERKLDRLNDRLRLFRPKRGVARSFEQFDRSIGACVIGPSKLAGAFGEPIGSGFER